MAAKKKNKKIVRYRRPRNINVGMIIFAIIFVYMAFSVYTYMKKEKVQFYEVVEGNIVNDTEYTGIVLREEAVFYTESAGYINYYVPEKKRASVGTRIYSIDETGSMTSLLANEPDLAVLTSADLADIKRQLSAFSMSFDEQKFRDLYDMQYTLEASVLEHVSLNMLGNLDALLESGIAFKQAKAAKSGVVSYSIDGFESLKAEQVTMADFNRADYSKTITTTKTGQRIEQAVPVYKLISSDNWSIVFPMNDKDVETYSGKTSLHVTFAGNGLETEGEFSIITGSDGGRYGKLDFLQYMVQFASDRYVTFELASEKADGLKIPVSAVTTKSFYLVPVDYQTQGGDSSNSGFMKERYSEAGTMADFVPVTIYYSTDEYYYIDMSDSGPLHAGDYIIKPDSNERYQIGTNDALQGVYNINKGFAVFKQIDIIKSNDEYHTVRKGTKYGLSVYDHIVLNAHTVNEGDAIYQ